eukprot:EG_transcript_57946
MERANALSVTPTACQPCCGHSPNLQRHVYCEPFLSGPLRTALRCLFPHLFLPTPRPCQRNTSAAGDGVAPGGSAALGSASSPNLSRSYSRAVHRRPSPA